LQCVRLRDLSSGDELGHQARLQVARPARLF
jgi:hypothetical protein